MQKPKALRRKVGKVYSCRSLSRDLRVNVHFVASTASIPLQPLLHPQRVLEHQFTLYRYRSMGETPLSSLKTSLAQNPVSTASGFGQSLLAQNDGR